MVIINNEVLLSNDRDWESYCCKNTGLDNVCSLL